MSIFSLPRTYGNLLRAREIAGVLTRHGFGHFLGRLRLLDQIPGLGRLKVALQSEAGLAPDAPAADRLARALEELGATFIKFGQLLATRPDLVPLEYLEALARLQDRVAPFSTEEAKTVVAENLDRPLAEIFRSFDDTPVASGSIGQVHFAVLADGREVVVKIKRPRTDRQVREDLDILLWIAHLAEKHIPELAPFRPVAFCEEFASTMRRELDFVSEAAYMAKAAKDLADEPAVVVPRIHWDCVAHDVLVQERIRGVRLSDPSVRELPLAVRQRLAATLAGAFMRQFFLPGLFHADPHPGNIFILEGERVALLDFGQAGHLSTELRNHLGLLLVSLSQGEFDAIADIYADMGGLDDVTDLREFKTDMIALIDRYYGVPMEKLDFARLFEELVTIARQNRVRLPRDLVILGKSFVTVVGSIQRLDPAFRMDAVAEPYTKKLIRSQLSLRSALKTSLFSSYRLVTLVRRMPREIHDLLRLARSGNLRVIFHHEALESLTHRLDRASNRLSLALIIGSIIIGSSLVLIRGGELGIFPVGGVPVAYLLATLGFGAALVLGFALIWSILRSNRS